MSVLPPIVAVKAICEPSGEKYGSISTEGVEVSRRAVPPLRDTSHKSPAYSNATESRLTAGCRNNRVPCAAAWIEADNNTEIAKIIFELCIEIELSCAPLPAPLRTRAATLLVLLVPAAPAAATQKD